ncbi:MAG: ATP-dependent DNA helicase [Candidatus Poseidoniaceae archaeon]|uniref:Putative DEAD 2 n=1 Tax=uncultured organism MedDCM-OCT-S04-C1 TaxID=743604 RepID=D6PJM3_9ZZZZ|nr:putative DEAD 2 [uncultured organism MedDCM-OCT-S04-C1]|tara:strand:- start:3954 stop:6014 length:2061 start_codon:yes stop_codon:yes gene_type:complete
MREQAGHSWLAHPTPREGQAEMIAACIDTLQKGAAHLASAPTGIGKTAAALAAALEIANSSEERKTIMFLTPRQSQHRIVVDTVRRINELRGEQKITLVDMIGQSGMCVEPFAGNRGASFSLMCSKHRQNKQCRPWLTNAPGFEKRILSDPLHVDELVEISKTHMENGEKKQTCPWKAARNAAKEAQVIVCDYNHLFIEEVRNASLKAMDLRLDDLIVIVDEAHNLPDRVRMGMQRRLTPTMVRNAASEIEEHLGNMQRIAQISGDMNESIMLKSWSLAVCKEFRLVLVREFKRMVSELKDSDEMLIEAEDVLSWLNESFDAVKAVANQATLTGGENSLVTPDKKIRIQMFKHLLETNEVDIDEDGDNEPSAHLLAHLIDVLARFGSGPALCLVFEGEGKDGRIVSHLLDAGLVAGPIFERTAGSILMSGTLDPPHMFADLLGLEKSERGESIHPSPFAKERRPIVVASDVTTLYRERGADNTQKIREHIYRLVQNTPGNVAIFVPSYSILNEIFETIHIPGVKKMVETRTWTKKDIGALMVDLEEAPKIGRPILLAGVFNGKLSEGIDYAGGILDAVGCVGIPNAPPSVFQKSLGGYIKDKFGPSNHWRYANSQPAINSILQAMGRPIRAMGDRALIVLLDRRNAERTYSMCYPADIRMNQVSNADGTGRFAKRFFSKVKREADI